MSSASDKYEFNNHLEGMGAEKIRAIPKARGRRGYGLFVKRLRLYQRRMADHPITAGIRRRTTAVRSRSPSFSGRRAILGLGRRRIRQTHGQDLFRGVGQVRARHREVGQDKEDPCLGWTVRVWTCTCPLWM